MIDSPRWGAVHDHRGGHDARAHRLLRRSGTMNDRVRGELEIAFHGRRGFSEGRGLALHTKHSAVATASRANRDGTGPCR